MITRMKCYGTLRGSFVVPFSSLRYISCNDYLLNCDFSQFNYIKLASPPSRTLINFTGVLSYKGIEYNIQDGLLVKPNGERALIEL